jgi:hypothetical protein
MLLLNDEFQNGEKRFGVNCRYTGVTCIESTEHVGQFASSIVENGKPRECLTHRGHPDKVTITQIARDVERSRRARKHFRD